MENEKLKFILWMKMDYQKREITSQTRYNEKTALLGKVSLNQTKTLYVLLGDYIAKISVLVAGILFVMLFFRKIKK